MKRDLLTFCVIFALMAFFSVFSVFVAEMTDALKMRHKYLPVTFEARGEDLLLSWSPLEYPCVYKVETLSQTTGLRRNIFCLRATKFQRRNTKCRARRFRRSTKFPREEFSRKYFVRTES